MEPSMRVISLGGGVQSVALYYMSSLGILPKADCAIMADTGKEKSETYRYLENLITWQKVHRGIPIIVRSERNLYQDLLNSENSSGQRFSSIPSFTKGNDGKTGMLRRQCTHEYKIQVVDNAIRDLYGLPKGARRPITAIWKGITTDEIERMDQPRSRWKIHVYPFTGYEFDRHQWRKFDWGMVASRDQVVAWYESAHLPLPAKSACVFCPYQSDQAWAAMKRNAPDDFAAAVAIDNAIRDSSRKGVHSPCYLHRSLQPLAQIPFDESTDIWWGECSGNCHV